ncbi:MAG: hypothetical protein GF309_00450 [Candidatus Lokiarchaeota archaeon]|nr:hypothetical protein [Candidatus Lokiarchaeota archaeon]
MNEKTLLDLCTDALDVAEKKGVDAAEIQAHHESELESEAEMGQVSSVNQKTGSEIAVRLYIGQRMGSAFTSIATSDSVEKAVDLAIAAAKASTVDEKWEDLPTPADYPSVEELWNSEVANLESSTIVERTNELIARSSSEEGLIPASAGGGISLYQSAYANTNGIEHSERGSLAYAFLAAVARTESGMTPMTFCFDMKRSPDLDLDYVIDEVTSTIRVMKETAKGRAGKHDVVMHPSAYGQLLQYTLVPSIRGDNVTRGKSKIGDKLGESIAAETLNVYDDGTNPRGIQASIADDEGVPRQKTPILEDGILQSFIWDNYWANRRGVESTGNASRNRRQGLVEVAPSNVVVESGSVSDEELISGIDYGYLIKGLQGAHSSNPESGDFSVVGNPAILIENGEPVGAVHGLALSGNVYDLLKSINKIASEEIVLQQLIGPLILFSDVSVVTKG